jgi:hypothetical protein
MDLLPCGLGGGTQRQVHDNNKPRSEKTTGMGTKNSKRERSSKLHSASFESMILEGPNGSFEIASDN